MLKIFDIMHENYDIMSCSNAKVKEFLKLRDNKKYKILKNKFTIEGIRLIDDVFRNKMRIDCLFLTSNCIKKISNTKYDLTRLSNYFTINEKIAKKMSLLKSNQGAFAVLKKPSQFRLETIQVDDLVLALYKIQDPGNLGTILRSALSFGFLKIMLFNCCDIYNDKVIRSSTGTIFRLNFLVCKNFDETLDYLQRQKIKTFAATPGKELNSSANLQGEKGVLVLGNEGNGLPDKVIKKCAYRVSVPMKQNSESLNVAVAGSILMYEMMKQRI